VSSLREIQSAFASAMLSQSGETLSAAICSRGLPGEQRLQVYRNNVFLSFEQALADVYPVIRRLVGDEFFRQLARRFIREYPSRSGNLHEFGSELALLLNGLKEAVELPYLPDVAALEWAYHEVFHAAESEPLDVRGLARVNAYEQERLRFALARAARLVASCFPVMQIWEANQDGALSSAAISLDAGGDWLLVQRRGLSRIIERLTPGEFALLSALAADAPLAEACEAAVCADPEVELSATMQRFVSRGVLTHFRC
jgi:hypothetical protein